jgi:hypothetical protein
MKQTRRDFLKTARNATAIALIPKGLEALADEPKTLDEFSYLDTYDPIIDHTLKYFKGIHKRTPEKNLIKAIIALESGSPQHRKTAFVYDPMQIANEGDGTLEILTQGKENVNLIGDFSMLDGKNSTPWINGRRDYSNSNMEAQSSILGGIGWLIQKATSTRIVEEGELQEYEIKNGDSYSTIAKNLGTTTSTLLTYNKGVDPRKLQIGQIVKFKQARVEAFIPEDTNWNDAAERYNGGGNPNYLSEVSEVKEALDKRN